MCGKQLHFFRSEENAGSSKRKIVAIPLDTIILLGVVFLLLFILFFSLGIERGRTMPCRPDSQEVNSVTTKETNVIIPVSQNTGLEVVPEKKYALSSPSVSDVSKTKEDTAKKIEEDKRREVLGKKYAIQVVSCTKENSAQEEVKKLQRQGFPAYAAKKNNFIVVYVGVFNDKVQAERHMEVLKKTYKDCILRTVK